MYRFLVLRFILAGNRGADGTFTASFLRVEVAKRSIDACDLADRNRTALAKHVHWTGARRSNKRRSVRECVQSERERFRAARNDHEVT